MGAKRIVLDTLEALFGSLQDTSILRAEIRRLFRKLKDMGLTAIVTAEQDPDGSLTRHGLEEYVSDCVIQLDNRVRDQVSRHRETRLDDGGKGLLPWQHDSSHRNCWNRQDQRRRKLHRSFVQER